MFITFHQSVVVLVKKLRIIFAGLVIKLGLPGLILGWPNVGQPQDGVLGFTPLVNQCRVGAFTIGLTNNAV